MTAAAAVRSTDEDRLLSAEEAAQLLGVSAWTIRDWAKDRRIPAIKLGKFWKFRRSALLEWAEHLERTVR